MSKIYRNGWLIALLGLALTPSCSPWSVYGWSEKKSLPQAGSLIGVGHIAVRGSGNLFRPNQPRRLLILALRRKGFGVDHRSLFRSNLSRNSQGFLTSAALLRLDSSFSGRYWIRGTVTIRPADSLLESRYNIDLEIQLLDLRSGRIVRTVLVHASEQPDPGSTLLLQGFSRMDMNY
ncbi:MAG: hypothetical protein KDK25_13985 [Leptospiraceae bacterium]|nr:hypothetical protein [Leptospiraceae bacterium]